MDSKIGSPCPFCGRALTERRTHRDGETVSFAYCAFDGAAWECELRIENIGAHSTMSVTPRPSWLDL